MTNKEVKDTAVNLTKKHSGKAFSGATVLFLFGLVFTNMDQLTVKVDGIVQRQNDNHIEMLKEIQSVRQDVSDDKVNYFGIIGTLLEDIKRLGRRD